MVSNYLKEYFKKQKISQYKIAKDTKIAQSKINLTFNNKRKLTADELLLIAKIYDLDLNKIKETIVQ